MSYEDTVRTMALFLVANQTEDSVRAVVSTIALVFKKSTQKVLADLKAVPTGNFQ